MNKRQYDIERRKVHNLLRWSSLSGSKLNCFQAYMSETDKHIQLKFELWLKLRRNGYDVFCEPIFNSGIRMDILAFKEGIFTNYEILHTEDDKKFLAKIKKYPPEINIIKIKSEKDLKDLEMF